jgi:hypothetical protein
MQRMAVIEGILAAESAATHAAVVKKNGEKEEEKREGMNEEKVDDTATNPMFNEKKEVKGKAHAKSRGKGGHRAKIT